MNDLNFEHTFSKHIIIVGITDTRTLELESDLAAFIAVYFEIVF